MKIGITCYPTYGGSGVVATELGIALAKRGHEIHFICYDRPYRLPAFSENIFYHEVQISKYPLFEYPPYTLALASRMADIALQHGLDILHVHYAIPHATSAYLAKQMLNGKIKVVTTLHGTDITIVGADPSFFNITKFAMEQSDAITSVSHYLKDKTNEIFKLTKNIDVIYNFMDPEDYKSAKPMCRREFFSKFDEPILMHISNFRPVKRIPDVIEIANKILKSKPIKLVMVGDGPDRALAEKMCKDYGISEHVSFLGKQNDVISLLKMADLLLFPSESESFGLAALEAMACSVPVIASKSGGTTEVVIDGICGYLAEIGDTDTMAKQALSLLNDKAKYKSFAEAGFKISHDRFKTDIIIPQYLDLYTRLLND